MRWKLYEQLFSLELRRTLSYRVDFWMTFLISTFVRIGIAYALWKTMFASTGSQEIGEFSFYGLVLYAVVAGSTSRIFRGGEFLEFGNEIYQGGFTKYIVYPVGVLPYRLSLLFARVVLKIFQLLISIVIFAALFPWPGDIHMSFATILIGVFTVLLVSPLFYAISMAVQSLAFWTDQVWAIVVMEIFITDLLGGVLLPLSVFPETLRNILYYLPFAQIIAFPAEVILGRIGPAEWFQHCCLTGVWTMIFFVIAGRVLRAGSYKYTGVGI